MKKHLGPILGFRGVSAAGEWCVSALIVVDAADAPTLSYTVAGTTTTAPATALYTFEGKKVLRFDLAIPTAAKTRPVNYTVAGEDFTFHVPADGDPTELAYVSCNGFSTPAAVKQYQGKTNEQRFDRWVHLLDRHNGRDELSRQAADTNKGARLHLLLMGGDQIYADQIFLIEQTEIKEWAHGWHPFSNKKKQPFTAGMKAEAESFYFNAYLRQWSNPYVSQALATVPALMIWDDHDIFDGWGSYPEDLQSCPVYQGIYKAAKTCFQVFQRQIVPGQTAPGQLPKQPGFSWAFRLGSTAIIAPDLRSERGGIQVASKATWSAVLAWLDEQKKTNPPTHLLFLSSIPLVYPSLRNAELLLAAIPGSQELDDDLADHWTTRTHIEEQKRLIRWLLDFATAAQCRITLLSGDVHVAASGRVISRLPEHRGSYAASMNQLISSGVLHPPPSGAEAFFIDHILSGDPPSMEAGLEAEMQLLPGTHSRLYPKRNWLSISRYPGIPHLWARWWMEGENLEPITKVIHACLPGIVEDEPLGK
jgi:hypothetical protein